MMRLLLFMLLLAAAFVTGVWYNEHATTDPVSHAVHQAADRVETIRQDLVARQRHLQSRDAHRERMIDLATRMITMMETQVDRQLQLVETDQQHKKVAVEQPNR